MWGNQRLSHTPPRGQTLVVHLRMTVTVGVETLKHVFDRTLNIRDRTYCR